MEKKTLIAAVLIAVAVIALGVMALTSSPRIYYDGITGESTRVVPEEKPEVVQGLDVSPHVERLQTQYQPDRDSYGMGQLLVSNMEPECFREHRTSQDVYEECSLEPTRYSYHIKETFSELPGLTEDFWEYKFQLMSEGFLDFRTLGEEYWKQPEIITNKYAEQWISFYKNNNPNYWYPSGYGTFPAIQWVTTKPGQDVELAFLIHASPGVEACQGLGLTAKYLDSVYSPIDQNTYQMEPKETTETHMEIIELDPSEVLLGKTYPKWQENWIHRVNFTIHVDETTPPGKYGIGLVITEVTPETSKEYEKHCDLYMDKGMTNIGFPNFQVEITVKEDE